MPDAAALIEAFREEVLRWNRQINLVSRQETRDRLDGLLGQCSGGHAALSVWLEENHKDRAGKGLVYFDLGSGGGLPGVVWHALWSADGIPIWSAMVEPRDKRAWFLERVARMAGLPPFSVMDGRWGEGEVPGSFPGEPAGLTVISLKALHLDDREVLEGLAAALASRPLAGLVVIARYYPPGQNMDAELEARLDLNPAGGARVVGIHRFSPAFSGILPVLHEDRPNASLVLSTHQAQPTP